MSICLLFTAPRLAYGTQVVQPSAVGGLSISGGEHSPLFMPQDLCAQSLAFGAYRAQGGCLPVGSANPAVGNVTNHGGPVMHSVTNYAIFWLPAGHHFDTPTVDRPYPNASDVNYEALVGQYFRDLSNTAYYYTVQQYTDLSGAPGLSTTFGGSWIDASPYPNSEGSKANPLQDSDIEAEVTKAMSANGWSAGDGNHGFFVFTGQNVYSCAGSSCSYSDYCAYHSAFQASDGQEVVYANIPDPGNANAGSCLATFATGSSAPNSGAFADSAVNLIAHEGVEAVTDPTFDGWYYQDIDHEIADECIWRFGSVTSDGSDIALNGHRYLVQEMWSDKTGGCYMPQIASALVVVPSYQLHGGGTEFTPPTFTYFSAGVLKNAPLSTTPQTLNVDLGSVWNVTGTLQGATSNERWQVGETAGGILGLGETFKFNYYHQYLVPISYAGGGAGSSSPVLAYSSLGRELNTSLGQLPKGVWLDAGTEYSATNPLQGLTATERWFTPAGSGNVSSSSALQLVYHQQYLLSVAGGSAVAVTPPSPNGDGFYDAGSSVTVSSARTWNVTTLTRQTLVSYGVDGESAHVITTSVNDSGDFSTPSITFGGPHQLVFGSTAQYLVGFRFTDAQGLRAIIPTALQIRTSQPNATLDVLDSKAWLDAGSSFAVKQLLWEGTNVAPLNQVVSVDAPQNVTIDARVFDATFRVSDYLQIPISGASANIQLSNGTSTTRTSGPDGTISMTSIPLGRFNATVSYLGFSQRISVDVAAQDKPAVVTLAASLPDLGAAVGGLAMAALVVYAALRRRRVT